MKKVLFAIGLLGFSYSLRAAEEIPACAVEPGPQEAVVGYITAMKEQRFEDAYRFVTATMTDGKPAAEWAALQARMFQLGGVSIGKVDVRAAKRALNADRTCAPAAKVPNVLHATDVANNQGSTEFEVYNVVLDGERWKIDSQESLFDEPAIREWFPEDEIPDFKDTAIP
jgi:hypothetical protein